MITNLCPYNGNQVWCPNPGQENQYGYNYHFDIMAQQPVIGDNPIVNFESVDCPGDGDSDYAQCQCASM
jgi:endoglucanase